MSFQQELLTTVLKDVGIAEIPGAGDHPQIVLAHELTKVIRQGLDPAGPEKIDEIPWCSSMMNLWMIRTCYRLNPGRTLSWLREKRFLAVTIGHLVQDTRMRIFADHPEDNGVEIPQPTWKAGAMSWSTWGKPVDKKDYQPGDICVFTRTGGGHVALYMGKTFLTIVALGGNQTNKVCQSSSYLKTRLVTVRRFI